MERTRIALEKARRQAKEPRAFADNRPAVAPAPSESSKVQYRETRVVDVPKEVLRANRIVADLTESAEADTYRILRAKVLLALNARDHSTLGICSAKPEEGKTLTAVNLALSLAMDVNHTILLADFDFRRPDLKNFFAIEPLRGLDDYLRGDAELAECLVHTGHERLVVLPIRVRTKLSSELVASPKMTALARELKERYPERIVLYDLPPLLASDDCLVAMKHVESVLLVVVDGETTHEELRHALDLVDSEKLIGTVLNKSNRKSSTYY